MSGLFSDAYFIPYKQEKRILYLPKAGKLVLVDKFVEKVFSELKKSPPSQDESWQKIWQAIINNLEKNKHVPLGEKSFDYSMKKIEPNVLGIGTTRDCQLRCQYCYNNSGVVKKDLSFEKAKVAINFVADCASRINETFYINIMGSGEPTFNWPLFTQIVDYSQRLSKDKCIGLKISMCTNGLLSEKQVEYIARNIDDLLISFDGPEEVHNHNRPRANGGGSYAAVVKTIKHLDRLKAKYSFSSVLTEKSLENGEALIREFKKYSPEVVKMTFQRAAEKNGTDLLSVENSLKRDQMVKMAKQEKVNILQDDEHAMVNQPCAMANFLVTPDGNISMCTRVSSKNDRFSEHFIYGRIDDENRLHLDKKVIDAYLEAYNRFDGKCRDCFAKYFCRKGCQYTNLLINGHREVQSEAVCRFNREKLKEYFIEKIENSKS